MNFRFVSIEADGSRGLLGIRALHTRLSLSHTPGVFALCLRPLPHPSTDGTSDTFRMKVRL